jgi:hypothetical protein
MAHKLIDVVTEIVEETAVKIFSSEIMDEVFTDLIVELAMKAIE